MGLLGCIEGASDLAPHQLEADRKFGSLLDAACEDLGLLVRPLINMAVFSPPLIITETQIDEMFDMNVVSTDETTKRQLIDEETGKISMMIDDWSFTQ